MSKASQESKPMDEISETDILYSSTSSDESWTPAQDLIHTFEGNALKLCHEFQMRFEKLLPPSVYVGPRTMVTVNPMDEECLGGEVPLQYCQLNTGSEIFGKSTSLKYKALYPNGNN